MADGKKVYGSEYTKHSMMDLVGSAVLPREFSNLELYDIENGKFFFRSNETYYGGNKVIYYVPKLGKEYKAPASYGWYVAKHDIAPGEFNPEDWRHVSIFTANDQYSVSNLEYVNRMHMMETTIRMTHKTSDKIVNINKTNEFAVTDFGDMPAGLYDIEVPLYESNKAVLPLVDMILVDFRDKVQPDYISEYTLRFGYSKKEDGTYVSTFESTVNINNPFVVKNLEMVSAGDMKLHLIGIDPKRDNADATHYVVFGIYTKVKA